MEFAKNKKELKNQEVELDKMYDRKLPDYIIGENIQGNLTVYTRDHDEMQEEHDEKLTQVVKHSPTGMSWGYGGSGPADLALTIMTMFGYPELYQDFKWEIVAKLPLEKFTLSKSDIQQWIKKKIAPNSQFDANDKLKQK